MFAQIEKTRTVNGFDLTGEGAVYIRCSTERQDLASQRSALDQWLKANNIEVKHRFEDFGYARDEAETRPDFQRMITMAERGYFQWILVDEQSRVATADTHEFFAFTHRLRKAGVRLYALKGSFESAQKLIGGDDREDYRRKSSAVRSVIERIVIHVEKGKAEAKIIPLGHVKRGHNSVSPGTS